MKKQYFTFLLLLMTSLVFSQRTNTKVLEKFNELKVYDRIIVSLVKSNENKLVISGDDKDEVSISNKNGLLKVRMKFDNFMDGDEAKATLYYTEELTLLDVNENAKINSNETFTATNVDIKAQEGGLIDLNINTDNVYVRSVSGSEITLKGNSTKQEISVNTGGKAYNQELTTKETEVVVMAGGRADVRATDNVIAKVKAGGSIYIHGNPKNITKDKVFGGKITEVD